MKAVILSRSSKLFATKRLAEEGRKLGMKVKIYDTLRLSIFSDQGEMKIFYKNDLVKNPNIVIPRIGSSITAFGGCVMFQLEKMKIPLLNSSMGMFNSRDKLRCTQILNAAGLPTPKTLMLRKPLKKDLEESDSTQRRTITKQRVEKMISEIGGVPVVIKLNKGTQGVGVVLCQSINEVYAQIDMLWKNKADFFIQEFIKESKGIDVRALVVNGEVIASMKRESKTGDFRSNTHQGGEVMAFDLDDESKKIAIQAANTVGLQVAGVDMLISKKGYKIIEVNSSPGFEGLEKATRKNVARSIMKYAYDIAKNNKNGLHVPQIKLLEDNKNQTIEISIQ